MKNLLRWILLAVAVAGLGYAVFETTRSSEAVESPMPEFVEASIVSGPRTTVIYFTTDVRCTTCRKIEALTQSALTEQFADELASGSIVFETHNIDQPENKPFVDAYQLSFKTVVVSSREPDETEKWVRLDKVWDLTEDPEGFHAYIAENVKKLRPVPM